MWDVRRRKLRATEGSAPDRVLAVAWSSDGRWLAPGSRDEPPKLWEFGMPRPGVIRLWNSDQDHSFAWAAHEDRITRMGFVGDGLVSASVDGTVTLLSLVEGRVVGQAAVGSPVTALAVHPRAGTAAFATMGGEWYVWSIGE